MRRSTPCSMDGTTTLDVLSHVTQLVRNGESKRTQICICRFTIFYLLMLRFFRFFLHAIYPPYLLIASWRHEV